MVYCTIRWNTLYKHTCKGRRKITARETDKTDDRLCYVKGAGVICVTEAGDDHVTGNVVPVAGNCELVPGLDFNDVLCFKSNGPLCNENPSTYPMSSVVGKCVLASGFVSVIPWDVLNEH